MKDCNKKSVERADSIDKLATLICGYGYYAHHNDDRDHPIPKDAVKEYLEMGASFARQLMMKDAVVIETSMMEDDCDDLTPVIGDMRNKGFKFGDRVKLLIIKEE